MAQKNKKVEDKIMDKWGNEESEVLIPAGKNIFGQPTEPMTKKDMMMMAAGMVSPFSTVGAAKSFVNIWAAVKGWRGYNLPSWMTKNQANKIIQKTSNATGVPKTKLLRFAKERVSGEKPSIKTNREFREGFYKERGKHAKGSRPPHGQLFGGWKGGAKHEIKKSVSELDMARFLKETISESTKHRR
jgi:hypothetical protein|tara:strand:+ start:50 stop:610 length:561 start_codon:yes stop_codon:yes gene_type:complete